MFVIAAAALDAEFLRHRDLHVIDITAVPDRLENAIGEAENQDVLNGFLAEIMIDAIDLRLVENRGDFPVQSFRGFEVAAKGLLDYDAAPVAIFLAGESLIAQLADDFRE